MSIEKYSRPIPPILIVEEEFESVVIVLMDEAVEGEIGAAFDISHLFFLDKLLLYGLPSHTDDTVIRMTTFLFYFITRQVNIGNEYSQYIIRSIRHKVCIC